MQAYYERGNVRLYHGDSRHILARAPLPKFDVLLSDPPFGMDWQPKAKGMRAIANDKPHEALPLLVDVLAAAKPHLATDAHVYLFCHWASWPGFYAASGAACVPKNALVWWKQRGGMGDTTCSYAPDYEVILFGMRGRRPLVGGRHGAVLKDFPIVDPRDRVHPTEKPTKLLKWLLAKSCPIGGSVLEPFSGSGATLVAAAELELGAVGMELDERYCEATARRLDTIFGSPV